MQTLVEEPQVAEQPKPQRLDFETWKQELGVLVRELRATENNLEVKQWDIGDWILQGVEFDKKAAYAAAKKITGWSQGTLYNIVWVTRKFPNSLRSETKLTWSHFKELARIDDEQIREKVFGRVNNGFEHTVQYVRESVDRALGKQGKRPGRTQAVGKGWVYVRVSLKPKYQELVEMAAEAEDKEPDVWLREIVVMPYLNKHREEIEAKTKEPQRSQEARAGKR